MADRPSRCTDRSSSRRRVFVVGLDCAEADLVETWMSEGHLPTLRALEARGCWGRLGSDVNSFTASVWPSFYYGVNPARTNLFSSFQFDPRTMGLTATHAAANPNRPFMAFAPGLRTIVADVPVSVPDSELDALQVVGWGAHAPKYESASHPEGLLGEVRKAIGSYPLKLLEEENSAQGDRYYTYLRERLLQGVAARRRLASYLLGRDRDWDLFIGVWSEPHSAGHRFWHFMDRDHPWHRADAPDDLKTAIRDVYAACDAALGELLGELPPDTTVLVTSVHGMAPNYNGQELVTRLLERWFDHDRGDDAPNARRLRGLVPDVAVIIRKALPQPVRDTVKHWLPVGLRHQARTQVMKSVYDSDRWPGMRAFCLPSDDAGYVRVNLRGREHPGLVEPGAEYEALLDELTLELGGLRNLDVDAPLIAKISRPQRMYDGPYRHLLPDLTLTWNTSHPIRGLRSARFGDLLDTRRLPQHRSGFHNGNAFVLGAGPGVRQGAVVEGGHILDLAPTVLALLGRGAPNHLDGRVLEGLLDRAAQPAVS